MDRVLINLMSVGFAKLSAGLANRDAAAAGVPTDGEALVRELAARAPSATNTLITRTVSDVWSGCRAVGLPVEIAEPHLAALAVVLEHAELASEDCVVIASGGPVAISAATDIADRIVAAAPAGDTEIDATVLGYLATTLLKSFAASGELLVELTAVLFPPADEPNIGIDLQIEIATGAGLDLKHDIAGYTGAAYTEDVSARAAPVSNAALTLAKIERADALGLSVPLLETLTVCLINRTKSAEIRHDDLVATADHAKVVESDLARLSEQRSAGVREFETAIGHFKGGRLAECDRALAVVEEQAVERTIAPMPDLAVTELAMAIRIVRAELQILQGVYHKAARHFGYAQRYLARAHVEARWSLAEREAFYYEVAAYQDEVPSYLDQAARACTSAIATMPDEQSSALISTARTVLARVLTIIGERDQAPERFEIAAQLLADAQETFAGSSSASEEAVVAALRAGALTRLGELMSKPDLLERAAWIVQSALELPKVAATGLLPEGLSSEADNDLELQLALAVAGFAVRTESAGLLETAASTIEAKLPSLLERQIAFDETGYSANLLAARCHQAMAAWLRVEGDRDGVESCIENLSRAYSEAGFTDLAEGARMVSTSKTDPRSAANAA